MPLGHIVSPDMENTNGHIQAHPANVAGHRRAAVGGPSRTPSLAAHWGARFTGVPVNSDR
jgi:hypothetical protein